MKRVKVALDVCIPPRAVAMLQSGFGDQGFDFIWEPDFAPSSAEDETWAVAFRRFGGEVIVTGDKNIARRPHQIMAFKDSGLISFFCQRGWAEQDLVFKAAHLCMWWPRIQQQLLTAAAGDCWWIPMGLRASELKKVEIPQHVQTIGSTQAAARALHRDRSSA